MFSSKFSMRLWKWICSPKKFKVILLMSAQESRFRHPFVRIEKEVVAHNRKQAIQIAKEEVMNSIQVSTMDCYSLGKVTSFENTRL